MDVLDKANLVGEEFCHGKTDNKPVVSFTVFLAPEIKFCFTIDEFGIVQEQKLFKGFNDSKQLLDRFQSFEMIQGKKVSALLPKTWKNSFDREIVIPTKMRFCNECDDKKMCNNCNNQINEKKRNQS